MAEDPAHRRSLGGGNVRILLRLVPAFRPAILATAGGPAIVHASDYAAVSSAKPAKADDILTLFATGLGPTTPPVAIGQPFPQGPLATVNAPVEVLVNGEAATGLYAGGAPGTVDGYQVNFRLPPGVRPGRATVQLVSAWIPGAEVEIPIR
jgi:uncharacterized protein (TIGR03437 family)